MLRLANRVLPVACVMALVACSGPGESASPPTTPGPPKTLAKNDTAPPAQPEAPAVSEATMQTTGAIAPPITFSSPESAMAVLTHAMIVRDESLLLHCFANGSAWYSMNTLEKPWHRTKFTYEDLANGLKAGGDYRGFLFGDDGGASLRDYFAGANHGAWKAKRAIRVHGRITSARTTAVTRVAYGDRRHVAPCAAHHGIAADHACETRSCLGGTSPA